MKEYLVSVELIQVVPIQAKNEEEAINICRNNFIASNRMRGNEPITFSIAKEGKPNES